MLEPSPSDIFRPGQILNNTYEVVGVLGRGGTGEVYRARNQISGRVVAIKVLSGQFSKRADYVDLLRREEQMRSIQHDAVVRYSECSRTEDGHIFLVMDFVDGPSLNDVMLSSRLEVRELLIVAHRVAEGLVATHARGIVHRDLSPDNIILRGGDPEAAVIIDFGIAKDTAEGAQTIVGDNFAGKYEYAAPEQVDGRADARSDLYCLGATLLAAWRGEVPFRSATSGEIVRAKQRPLDTEGVPQPLRSVIDWLAAPDPAARPQSAGDVVARLEGVLRPSPPNEPRGKSRWPWIAVPAVVLVGLGIAWAVGVLPPLPGQGPPPVEPYVFEASRDPAGGGYLGAHMPDTEGAEELRAAYLEAVPGGTATIDLGSGAPIEDWGERMAELIRLLADAETWEVQIVGTEGAMMAIAPDASSRDRLSAALEAWSTATGLTLTAAIAAGPEKLPVDEVEAMLADAAACGPLHLIGAPEGQYEIGDTIVIAGDVATREDEAAIGNRLQPQVGDRQVSVNVQVLNEYLCAIRAVLPDVPSDDLSILLAYENGEQNLSGVYHGGEFPVADIEVDERLEGWLWVLIVTSDGDVIHALPTRDRPVHNLADLGQIVDGKRRVRVLHSRAEISADTTRLAIKVEQGTTGTNEVHALVTRSELMDVREHETVADAIQALSRALAGKQGEVIATANQLLEARQ